MRATLGVSATETKTILASLRLVLVFFEVRMWRILDWPRLNLPVPVFLKRLAAPECVFNFGIVFLTGCCVSTTFQVYTRFRRIRLKSLRSDPPPPILRKIFRRLHLGPDLCGYLLTSGWNWREPQILRLRYAS